MIRRERGAALVMAMLVVALSVLLVSGAFYRQSAMVRQVENEVAAAQAQRLLEGAVDWARVILREDARTSATDHLGEPWAVSLEQTRLDNTGSDKTGSDNTGSDNTDPDPAWLSGAMEDAQSRFNLRNISGPTGPIASEVAVLGRLLELVGANAMLAERLAQRIDAAISPRGGAPEGVTVLPATLEEIVVEDAAERDALARLRPFVTMLPTATAVNANTAPAEVLAARFDNLALADARRLVASRDRAYFKDVNDVLTRIPGLQLSGGAGQVTVATQFFLLRGTVEFRRAHLQALVLLKREAGRVEVLWTREAPV
jgi:general secretion pathway protein K